MPNETVKAIQDFLNSLPQEQENVMKHFLTQKMAKIMAEAYKKSDENEFAPPEHTFNLGIATIAAALKLVSLDIKAGIKTSEPIEEIVDFMAGELLELCENAGYANQEKLNAAFKWVREGMPRSQVNHDLVKEVMRDIAKEGPPGT